MLLVSTLSTGRGSRYEALGCLLNAQRRCLWVFGNLIKNNAWFAVREI